MDAKLLLWPVLVLVLLTFVTSGLMLRARIREMKQRRIHPQKAVTRGQYAQVLQDTQAADQYQNLLEAPLLFYIAMLAAYVTSQASPSLLGLAWLYVAARLAHWAIHIGYNKVMHRFAAFALSMLVLLCIWLRFAWAWLA